MFREMRRFRQQLTREECEEILTSCSSGVLAVHGDDGYPYAVPLNYVYRDGRIYFHCAKTGHKIDAIRSNNKVSFCVVSYEENVPEKFTTKYKSVIAFGKAYEITDKDEIYRVCKLIADKFSPDEPREKFEAEMSREGAVVDIVSIDCDHISGKQAKELLEKDK